MTAHPKTREIFDHERANWYSDPRSAFDSWMAHQAFKASSADVYRAQWGLFLEWLTGKRIDLRTVDRLAIEQFVTQLEIRKPQRVRYLRLIERVLDHVREIEMASTNPARFIAQDGEAPWRDARENEPTGFLAHGERAALIRYLFSPIGDLPTGQRWRERRDRALVGAFLGGGVKTGEAAALTVSNYSWSQPWLTVEATNSALNRETRLAPFAIALLDQLDQRAQDGAITRRPAVPIRAVRAPDAQGHHAARDRCRDRSCRHRRFPGGTRQSANLAQYIRCRFIRKWHGTRACRAMARVPAANLGASAASSMAKLDR